MSDVVYVCADRDRECPSHVSDACDKCPKRWPRMPDEERQAWQGRHLNRSERLQRLTRILHLVAADGRTTTGRGMLPGASLAERVARAKAVTVHDALCDPERGPKIVELCDHVHPSDWTDAIYNALTQGKL